MSHLKSGYPCRRFTVCTVRGDSYGRNRGGCAANTCFAAQVTRKCAAECCFRHAQQKAVRCTLKMHCKHVLPACAASPYVILNGRSERMDVRDRWMKTKTLQRLGWTRERQRKHSNGYSSSKKLKVLCRKCTGFYCLQFFKEF